MTKRLLRSLLLPTMSALLILGPPLRNAVPDTADTSPPAAVLDAPKPGAAPSTSSDWVSQFLGRAEADGAEPGAAPSAPAAISVTPGVVVPSPSAAEKQPEAPLMTVVKTIVPTNIIGSVAKEPPDMLGLMFFALFFGIALTLVGEAKTRSLLGTLEGIYEAVVKCIELVMRLAPYAVFCLLFTMTARFGFGLLLSLGWFIATVLLGLAIHMFGVYSLSVRFLSKISPIEFFRRIKTVMVTAFSTSSSNATLPTALRVSEENLGVPREINSFVLTVGATANQNGTALYEGVTVLFLAQLAGVDLSLGKQLMVVYLAILGGIGTAGVPSGSIPFIVVVLATIGINPALIAIILGVDRILDMCRTVLNVTGDLTIATYVARSEGVELMKERQVPAAVDL